MTGFPSITLGLTTYTRARAELARLLDRVGEDREVVVVRRRERYEIFRKAS